ncbi:MAG: hypothetical protein AAB793_00310 [Patescibacteria group bacterium]
MFDLGCGYGRFWGILNLRFLCLNDSFLLALYQPFVYEQIVKRIGNFRAVFDPVFQAIFFYRELAESRENIRSLMKELNLTYGTKKLITLDRVLLKELIERLAGEIKQVE